MYQNKLLKTALLTLVALTSFTTKNMVHADVAAPASKIITMTGKPYSENANNPLAVKTWAVNNGFWDNKYQRSSKQPIGGPVDDYTHFHTSGATHTYLKRIVSQPYSTFFTPTNSSASSATKNAVSTYIKQLQRGDSKSLVQLTLFGIYDIGGGESAHQALTITQQNNYKKWIQYVSGQIKTSKVAIIMEPDAAMLADRPTDTKDVPPYKDRATRRNLIKWATQYIATHNKNAAVYLDSGDADWLNVADATKYLKQVGIQYVRGFALGATHYDTTTQEINYAKQVSDSLSKNGVKNKKAIIDTSDNGNGYTYAQWFANTDTKKLNFDNSRIQTKAGQARTNVLGIAPTWTVANSTTGIKGSTASTAKKYVDGYLWFGRPWLTNQAWPYNESKAVAAAKYTKDATLLKIK